MKKKVMFMMPTLGGGGAEKVLVNLLKYIDKEKFDITLILLEKSGTYIECIDDDIRLKYILKNRCNTLFKIHKFFIKYFPKQYYKVYIKEKYDVEIAFSESLVTNLIGNSINKKSKKIAWVHCNLERYNWISKYYKNEEQEKTYRNFNEIVFVSNECKSGFENVFRVDNVYKHVIYNPIINKDIWDKANESTVDFNKKTIVAVGSLSKVKGFDNLLKAFKRLREEFDVSLNIIGEGKERENLEEIIQKEGIKDADLIGFVNNPYKYMKNADFIVSSSHSEAYPSVIIESIILNKAIVATNVEGNKEAIMYGQNGLLCNDSVEGLYYGMKKILCDDEYKAKIEENNKVYSKQLDYKKQISIIEKLILD